MSANDDRKCARQLGGYYACLSKSGRDPAKCRGQESALSKCAETDPANDYCLAELRALFHCTRNPGPNACAAEFLRFRECNRPGGPEILIKVGPGDAQDDMYKLSPAHMDKYNLVSDVICPVAAPRRSSRVVRQVLERMKEVCGLKNFEEKFTPQVKS